MIANSKDRPAPLTTPEIDVRSLEYMPLFVRRLRDSDLVVLSSAEAFRSAVLLWCAAWHQVPAGSLPNNDRILSSLAGYGVAIDSWMKVREEALRGFIECSDGRLYHTVICERALDSWNWIIQHEYRKMWDRLRKENQRRKEKNLPLAEIPRPSAEQWVAAGRPNPPEDIQPWDPRCNWWESMDSIPGQEPQTQPNPSEQSDVPRGNSDNRSKQKESISKPVDSLRSSTGTGEMDLAGEVPAPTRKRKSATSTKTKMDKDFSMPTEWLDYAIEKGMDKAAAEREFLRFREYWVGTGTLRESWFATWRNRILTITDSKIVVVKLESTSPEFQRFWAEYPKRARLAEAWATWQQLAIPPLIAEQIIVSLKEQKQSERWLEKGGQFVPPPDSYLANRKWEENVGRRSNAIASVMPVKGADAVRAGQNVISGMSHAKQL